MIGSTISHYRILEKLGEGGMGVVYKAHDTKLQRDVALKFLPPYLSSDANEKERFYQEARAAASLTHQNVAVIHEIGEHEGRLYLAMELVEGQTLKRLVEQDDSVSIKKVLEIAIQICEGLAAAHEKNVVHRDIKSDNIMVTPKGLIKIMDFGLAKLKGSTKLTKAGSTLGTAAYMSPEQARGEAVDHRSDIFSAGVVFYELLTGKLPFRGEHHAALMYSLINENPQPLARFNEQVSPEIDRVISKALAKDVEDRYQNAVDLLADLRREWKNIEYAKAGDVRTRTITLPTEVARPGKRSRRYLIPAVALGVVLAAVVAYLMSFRQETAIDSIAALPLVNVNADPNTEYLTDGITESIINSLSQLPNLRVIPRSTAFRYKGKDIDLKDVGNTLKVGAVLTGRLVQHGDNLNIQVELIDVANESQLWGAQYDRKLDDLLSVQGEIVREVSSKLHPGLTGEEKRKVSASSTTNNDAYQLYLKGRYLTSEWTAESATKGLEYLKRAVEIDPNFALGYAGLGKAYYDGTGSLYSHLVGMPKAREALAKALSLDDHLVDAHLYLAVIKMYYDWDWKGSSEEFGRVLTLEPGNVDALAWHAWYLFEVENRPEDALAQVQKALSIDPLSQIANLAFGRFIQHAERYNDAIRHYRSMIELDITETYAELRLADCYTAKQMYDEALSHIHRQIDKNGRTADIMVTLGWTYGRMGKKAEALQIREELVSKQKDEYVRPLWLAVIDVAVGENDRAFEEIQKAYEQRDEVLVGMRTWRYFGPVRNDPRFKELAKKVGLPE